MASLASLGSSPLTRGKLWQVISSVISTGLIPAHAGKTRRGLRAGSRQGAHPRSRGENAWRLRTSQGRGGSSPLTRGKLHDRRPAMTTAGLIPAHAGKTFDVGGWEGGVKAHPRSRGENSSEAGDEKGSTGSSPLTRGKRGVGDRRGVRNGLIPAHAGKTHALEGITPVAEAHPRSRGENAPIATTIRPIGGSSPLTRGKLRVVYATCLASGLIPAHAGKTRQAIAQLNAAGAHPRSRGENSNNATATGRLTGSSPLTRGKHAATTAAHSERGLIPAHAGKTT